MKTYVAYLISAFIGFAMFGPLGAFIGIAVCWIVKEATLSSK